MISIQQFRTLALSFPGATEAPHFERTSFRYNKKIFASLDSNNHQACLMLSVVDQSVFILYDKTIIYPVPNKWGKAGATVVELATVPMPLLKDALTQAYLNKSRNPSK